MKNKKILVLSAHPDDMEFGCGATLYEFSRKGYSIVIYVATAGEYGASADVRKKEQEKSAKILKADLLWGSSRILRFFLVDTLLMRLKML